MTRLGKSGPLILAVVALLLSCASCLAPDIWDLPILPRLLMVYGEHPTLPTVSMFLALLLSLVVLVVRQRQRPASRLVVVAIVLMSIAGATTACAALSNVLLKNTTLSSVRLEDRAYYLTEHSHIHSYGYSFYECRRSNGLCFRIAFSIPADGGSPSALRVDASAGKLYVLDWRGRVIYEHSLQE